MNFMPTEDGFFDEPLMEENIMPSAPLVSSSNQQSSILESSLRQEKLLEKIATELERMNRRLSAVERLGGASGSPAQSPSGSNKSATRGNLVLPPGSRQMYVPAMTMEKKPADPSAAEEAVVRERDELEAIQRRRAEEESRLARIEAERIQREAEEERRRLAEMARMEEEKRMKKMLEEKTRGLMTGLLTGGGGGGLFDDLDDTATDKKKNGGGLFDD